jgi:hypothetical protein
MPLGTHPVLQMKNLRVVHEAKLNMFDEVAGGVGSRVMSDGLFTTGKRSASPNNSGV